jgi:hypothetical protein
MVLLDSAWNTKVKDERPSSDYSDILSEISPQLARILFACSISPTKWDGRLLFRLHFVLDLSWDDLRATICPLRRITGDEEGRFRELRRLSLLDNTFVGRLDPNDLLLDLAKGLLRLVGAMVHGGWTFE